VSAALAVATRKREGGAPAVQHEAAPDTDAETARPEVGVPRWLQHRAAGAAGDDSRPRLQHKCAACAAGGAPCPACAEEEAERLQKKEQPGNGAHQAQAPARIHALAHHGVQSAHAPLPHFARIQAAFGRHDLSDVKAQVGGPAGEANDRMRSLGYTVGDRIGFRASPDLRLAAHEATHVVQQRAGVQLKDGVGRPGDGYEQQADAVADAVERGESAEPLLDRAPGGSSPTPVLAHKTAATEPDEVPVQHRLAIDATRLFEPPAPPAPVVRTPSGGKGKAAPGAEGEGKTAQQPGAAKDGTDAAADADAGAPPAAGTKSAGTGGTDAGSADDSRGAPGNTGNAAATPGGGSPGTQPGGADPKACTGTGKATRYKAPKEEPAEKPKEQPPDEKTANKSKAEASADTPEVPEPDDCRETLAAQPGGQAAAPAGAAPSGAPGSATPAGAAPSGTAPAQNGGAPPAQDGGPPPAQAAPAKAGADADAGPTGRGDAGVAAEDDGQAEAGDSARGTLDAAVGQAEGQRTGAVAAYMASAAALAMASDGTRALHSTTRFAARPEASSADVIRAAEGSKRVDGFFAQAADRLNGAIAFASQQLPDRLGAQAEAGKAQLAAAIENQKSAISGRIEQARTQAQVDAATAREQVLIQADVFATEATAQTSTAIETLRAGHAKAMGQVDPLESATLDRVNQIFAEGRVSLEALGPKVGAECVARGEEFANEYEAFKINRIDDDWWNGYLTDRQAEAQQNAARETADGFRKSVIDSAKQQARDVTKAHRKTNRCAVIAAASRARDTLDQQLTTITAALEAARDTALQQAGETRDRLLASIDGNLAATLHQLDQQEHDQRQAVDDTGYMQQVMLEQVAHASAASLQRSVVDAVAMAQSGLATVQAQFAASPSPDLEALDAALALAARRIDDAVGSLEAGLDSGAVAAEEQLVGITQQGLASLDGVTESSDQLAAATGGGFGTAMGAIASSDNFAAMRSGFTQQVQQTAAGGSAALLQAVGGMSQACEAVIGQSTTALAAAARDLEQNLRTSKQGLECEIPKRADAAAAKEAPAWKRAIAIVLIYYVIVIMIVVTVVTFGSAGIIAGIIVGAIVGAVTSAMISVATSLWNNQSLSGWEILKAAAIGALTGAIGGGLGAWMGKAIHGAVWAWKLAATVGFAVTFDAATQIVTQLLHGGFSYEHFSVKQLGLTALIAIVTFGIGAKFGGKIQIGGGARAPTAGGVHPIETPPAGVHPTEPPVATPQGAEPPTTTARPGETTTPAAGPKEPTVPAGQAGEPLTPPTPETPQTETPTPAARPTEPPVAAPQGAEPPTTTARPGETTTPTAGPKEPTVPAGKAGEPPTPPTPETPTVEAGAAPKTPEEAATLETTANKESEDLTPAEATTEREVAGRGKGEPVNDPPFTTEHELPNGHEVLEAPEGKSFKRCSGSCAIYDAEGNLIEIVDEVPAPGAAQDSKGVAHDIGVQQGREAASADPWGLQEAPDWVNPLENQGKYGQGFDDVLIDAAGNECLAEYKGGEAELRPGQMEREWVQDVINRMRATGDTYWADRLQAALDAGRLRGVAYSTPIDPVTGVPGPTTVINRWTY
jgi:hypothetical protein